MKAPRIPATPQEVTPTLVSGNTITQHCMILTTEIPASRLLNEAKREPLNKLLKIKGRHKKDVKNKGTSQ